jgi:hypothetical protein
MQIVPLGSHVAVLQGSAERDALETERKAKFPQRLALLAESA